MEPVRQSLFHEFYGRKAILRSTPRPVTPFGGLAVLVEFWRQLDL
ncbi:hypothetical protein M2447_001964, partial [Ereboglobus sp. PH5-10]|nr:hypothetical protein [Ereboglobus sp. PH5-10]